MGLLDLFKKKDSKQKNPNTEQVETTTKMPESGQNEANSAPEGKVVIKETAIASQTVTLPASTLPKMGIAEYLEMNGKVFSRRVAEAIFSDANRYSDESMFKKCIPSFARDFSNAGYDINDPAIKSALESFIRNYPDNKQFLQSVVCNYKFVSDQLAKLFFVPQDVNYKDIVDKSFAFKRPITMFHARLIVGRSMVKQFIGSNGKNDKEFYASLFRVISKNEVKEWMQPVDNVNRADKLVKSHQDRFKTFGLSTINQQLLVEAILTDKRFEKAFAKKEWQEAWLSSSFKELANRYLTGDNSPKSAPASWKQQISNPNEAPEKKIEHITVVAKTISTDEPKPVTKPVPAVEKHKEDAGSKKDDKGSAVSAGSKPAIISTPQNEGDAPSKVIVNANPLADYYSSLKHYLLCFGLECTIDNNTATFSFNRDVYFRIKIVKDAVHVYFSLNSASFADVQTTSFIDTPLMLTVSSEEKVYQAKVLIDQACSKPILGKSTRTYHSVEYTDYSPDIELLTAEIYRPIPNQGKASTGIGPTKETVQRKTSVLSLYLEIKNCFASYGVSCSVTIEGSLFRANNVEYGRALINDDVLTLLLNIDPENPLIDKRSIKPLLKEGQNPLSEYTLKSRNQLSGATALIDLCCQLPHPPQPPLKSSRPDAKDYSEEIAVYLKRLDDETSTPQAIEQPVEIVKNPVEAAQIPQEIQEAKPKPTRGTTKKDPFDVFLSKFSSKEKIEETPLTSLMPELLENIVEANNIDEVAFYSSIDTATVDEEDLLLY